MKTWLKWLIRIPLLLVALAVGLLLLAWLTYRLSDHTNGSLVTSGEVRRYLLYVPPAYDPNTPVPLVVSIHGFAQWPAHQSSLTAWNDLADEYGFIVVHPSGTGFPKRWRTSGTPGSETDPALDVTFISEIISKLEGAYNIDPARIYVNGLSNGGGMSVRLVCDLPGRIAAFGSVAGAYTFPWSDCASSPPVPAIIFHGTADPIVPFQGGPSRDFDTPFPAIPAWVEGLAQRNGCSPDPQEIFASPSVRGIQYADCASDVIFYTITGGGHTWPGGHGLPKFITGVTTYEIDATRLMWDFFRGHPLEPNG
jgi:polyhydroxybutyrate depolymerase